MADGWVGCRVQSPDTKIGDLARLIQAEDAAEGGLPAPPDRIRMTVTPPKPRSARQSTAGMNSEQNPAGGVARLPPLPEGGGSVLQTAATAPAGGLPDMGACAAGSKGTAADISAATQYLALASPRRLLNSFSGVCRRGNLAGTTSSAPPSPTKAQERLPVTSVSRSAPASPVKDVRATLVRSASSRMLRAVASPLALVPGFS